MKLKDILLSVALFFSQPSYPQTVTHVKLTCYHPVQKECDDTPLLTSDGSKIDLAKLKAGRLRWCAVSRDLLWLFPKDRPKRIWIEGYGIYEVHDVTNKRLRHTVDILIHPADKRQIYHKRVKIKIL